MTTFMKVEAVTYFILKVLGYIAGPLGAFAVIGLVGGFEGNVITAAQFWVYEFFAFCLIGFSVAVYYVREAIKLDYFKRRRMLRRRVQRLTHAR